MPKLLAIQRSNVRDAYQELHKRGFYLEVPHATIKNSCMACLFAQNQILFMEKFKRITWGDKRYRIPEHCYPCRERTFEIEGVPVKKDVYYKKGA